MSDPNVDELSEIDDPAEFSALQDKLSTLRDRFAAFLEENADALDSKTEKKLSKMAGEVNIKLTAMSFIEESIESQDRRIEQELQQEEMMEQMGVDPDDFDDHLY